MATDEAELEKMLTQAGIGLLEPPSEVDKLFAELDRVERLLSRVEQSPSRSMQTAIAHSTNALVANKLLRHANVDIKVAVASCISEITRITAPDAPYDDDQMKDVFQLIVSSFENLSDKFSRSYSKRTAILETVAKVRSCVVMLDLECDGLIVEMFQHFLNEIREYHQENVFSSMETIMTLVLEESEDISPELLSPILASAKRGSEDIQPIARKLGERVFRNCAIKLKPYLTEAMTSLGLSLDDYSNVVASICQGTTIAAEQSDDNASEEKMVGESKLPTTDSEEAAQVDESKLASASPDAAPQVAKESVIEEAVAEEDNPPIDSSPKRVMSNGVPDTEKTEDLIDPDSATKANQLVNTNGSSRVEKTDDSDNVKSVKPEAKPEQLVKRRGRKPTPLISPTEPSDSPQVDNEKEAERPSDRLKSRSKEGLASPSEDPPVDPAVDSEKEKEISVQISSPKAPDSEAVIAFANTSGSIPDESRPKKMGRPKKKDNLAKKASASADIVYKKASEGMTSDSEVKPQKRSGKKKPTEISMEDKTPTQADTLKNDNASESDSEAKLGKKMEAASNAEVGSSLKKKEDGKRYGRGKAASEKAVSKSAIVADDKDIVSSPKSAPKLAEDEGRADKTYKSNKKRKQTPGNGKASDSEELGDNMVGKKVQVWWPKDQQFYKGVVESYDRAKKKHTVSYDDGDREVLILKKERWEFIGDDSGSVSADEEQVPDYASPPPDASPDVQKKKKAKTSDSSAAKQGKMEVSPPPTKRVGGAGSSSTKPKSASKSVLKSDEDNIKVDSTNKPKNVAITKTPGGSKSKNKSQNSSGKTAEIAASETVVIPKSKDVEGGGATPKTGGTGSTKSKQEAPKSFGIKDTPKTAKKETPKTSTKEPPKTAGKSKGSGKSGSGSGSGGKTVGVNDKEKEKPSSSKVAAVAAAVEAEDANRRKTPDEAKAAAPESAKGKTPESSSKSSGKKRRRGVRS